ncbi:MAG TPA: helix-turn-helix domain-containing protein [Myxococcales bacterium]|nr:helix-turn-helix domain-containing protein [Myxococcales bacterium]
MARATSRKYALLDGRQVSLDGLDARERAFLADLEKMVRRGISYFEIYRAAVGPGSVALGGRNRIDRRTAQSPLYLVAMDLATRAGIKQGLILAPEHEGERARAPADGSMISVAQAADLIGISRAAVYKAIEKGALRSRRIGNVTIVDRASAAAYRERRSGTVQERPADQPRLSMAT